MSSYLTYQWSQQKLPKPLIIPILQLCLMFVSAAFHKNYISPTIHIFKDDKLESS